MIRKTYIWIKDKILRHRLYSLVAEIATTEYDQFSAGRAELTEDERSEIVSLWGSLNPTIPRKILPPPSYFIGFELFKANEYFDAKWLTAAMMYPRIILALEDPVFQSALVHKAGFSMYLGKIKQPRNIVKCINGQYFDEQMNPVTKVQAAQAIRQLDSVIIKSTYNSCQGKSVQKINKDDNIENIIESYNGNFVCQELIKQSAEIAQFHPSSVNTLRVVTLFINGCLSICEIILRIGQNGSIVDNAGSGGIMIGCDENGCLRDYGYDHYGNRHYDNGNGLTFKGKKISGVHKVLQYVRKYHTYYFPSMGVVAWDWSIDQAGEPVFIEANLGGLRMFPDITTSQLAIGKPFFGERTEEVIDYVNSHQERIWQGLNV